MKGICLDEDGKDQDTGVTPAPKELSKDGCLNWCNLQDSATGCEYQIGPKMCFVHTKSVLFASGNSRSLCFVFDRLKG